MKITYISDGKARQASEVKKPFLASGYYLGKGKYNEEKYKYDLQKYNAHIASLPRYPVQGEHNWKDGQELVEGVDYKFGSKEFSNIIVIIPLEQEDEIYDSIYMEVVKLVEKDNIQCEYYRETANKLKEQFTITRKQPIP